MAQIRDVVSLGIVDQCQRSVEILKAAEKQNDFKAFASFVALAELVSYFNKYKNSFEGSLKISEYLFNLNENNGFVLFNMSKIYFTSVEILGFYEENLVDLYSSFEKREDIETDFLTSDLYKDFRIYLEDLILYLVSLFDKQYEVTIYMNLEEEKKVLQNRKELEKVYKYFGESLD